jgi:hypothetical protein
MAFRKPAARQQVDTAAIAEAVASAVRSHLETEVPGFGALPEAQQEWLYISVIRFCRRFHVKPEKDKIGAYLDEAFRIELDDGELFNVVVPRLRNGWAKYVALCGKKNEGVVHVERYPPLEEVSSSPIAMDDMHPHHDQGDSVADAPWLDHGHEDDDVMSPGRGTKRVSSEQRQSAHSKVAKASDQSDSDFEDSESGQQRAVAGPSSGAGKACKLNEHRVGGITLSLSQAMQQSAIIYIPALPPPPPRAATRTTGLTAPCMLLGNRALTFD